MVRPAGRRGIATRPFTFAQDHIGQAQKADLGRLVQVQLPSSSGANGDPATDWKFRNEVSGPVPLIRTAQVKSPARIDGFDIMTVFEFMLSPAAGARTVIASEPDNLISPTGVYTILLHPLN